MSTEPKLDTVLSQPITSSSNPVESTEEQKKCCKVHPDYRCALLCCIKTWSCSLNCCEGILSFLSNTCLFCSKAAIDCNKCLEYIDCDNT